jgi:murein DD-endopeptidase MepM/ murein hydrolase activator NlpD
MNQKRILVIVLSAIAALFLFSVIITFVRNKKAPMLSDEEIKPTEIPVNIKKEFGIPVDSFIVEDGKIKRNQIITDLLKSYSVSDAHINSLHVKGSDIIDFTNIKTGNKYTVFLSKDGSRKLRYLVYEHTPLEFFIFEDNDTLTITRKERQVVTVQKTASAVIDTSLWHTMKSHQLNPVLAMSLSEIYAWSIDFFALQKGDAFKVQYEEQYVDSISIGITKIYAAWFRHNGQEYYAIPFIQDNREEFFDLNGNSLKKAFLKAPLKFSRITSRFTNSRFHPVLKIYRPHHGVDYAAPYGTPVHAVGSGRILSAGFSGGAGRMVKIKHNGNFVTGYMHLSRLGQGIRAGASVAQGTIIGYVGSSGLSTGPHLDFRFWRNGQAINPLKVISPPTAPVRPLNRPLFETVRRCYRDIFDHIQL